MSTEKAKLTELLIKKIDELNANEIKLCSEHFRIDTEKTNLKVAKDRYESTIEKVQSLANILHDVQDYAEKMELTNELTLNLDELSSIDEEISRYMDALAVAKNYVKTLRATKGILISNIVSIGEQLKEEK